MCLAMRRPHRSSSPPTPNPMSRLTFLPFKNSAGVCAIAAFVAAFSKRPAQSARVATRNWCGGVLHKSVTNVLQEPLGRNFTAFALLHRLFINPAADRGEQQSLIADVAVKRDLVAPCASLAFARRKIRKIRLVAAAAPIREFRAVAAKTGLRIPLRDPLHLLDGAADERRR